MERAIEDALREAQDLASAAIWRRAASELAQGLRLAVAAADAGTATRLAHALEERSPQLTAVALSVDVDEGPGLGAEDRLLGVHALVWATPITAPLGQQERATLPALDGLAPGHRAVVLADAHLLELMSDDPAAEAAEVRDRLEDLVPDGWALLDPAGVDAWVDGCLATRRELTVLRLREVAARLVADALDRQGRALEAEDAALADLSALCAQEDEALEDARRKGRRVAAHLLSAMRRRTEELLLDLREFLDGLQADLRPQVEAVDVDTARVALPHWLHHVVERWVGERLTEWRVELLQDLRDASVDEDEARRAELLVPALYAGTMPNDSAWGQRLGVSAAVGGGAAMMAFGLLVPGVVAIIGGLAWSALGRSARRAQTRERLVEAAGSSLRHMGEDASRLLLEQLQQAEEELQALGEERARSLAEERAAERGRLEERLAFHRARRAGISAVRDALRARIQDVDATLLPESS